MLRQTVTHQQREHDGKPMKPVMVRAWDFEGDMTKANLGPVTQESLEENNPDNLGSLKAWKTATHNAQSEPVEPGEAWTFMVGKDTFYAIAKDDEGMYELTLHSPKGGQYRKRHKTAKEAAQHAAKHYGLQESKSFDELGDYTRVPAHKLRTGDVVFHPTLRRQVRVSWNEVQTTGEKIWLTFYTLDGKIESGNKRQMSVERGQQFVVYPDMYDASFMRDAADEQVETQEPSKRMAGVEFMHRLNEGLLVVRSLRPKLTESNGKSVESAGCQRRLTGCQPLAPSTHRGS